MQVPIRSIALALSGWLIATPVVAEDNPALPRRPGARDEAYPGVTVRYEAIRTADGQRLRTIVTHPERPAGRMPTIFVVGWLSCDTIEAPPGSADGTKRMLQTLAQIPGFATVRLEKAGVGDSEGDCSRTDFIAELTAYRQAFKRLKDYPFVDPDRMFLFGMSNGAGFAPLVAEGAAIRGYVVDGGWVKTWFEHMLEIERRRLALAGRPPAELNALMKREEQLYSAYLLERRSPHEIFASHPELRILWEGPDEQQYGRPVAYYQQLQDLDLIAAWSAVRVPVLALHGEYDWIMSRADIELVADLVNRNIPGSAEFAELPHTGHTFENYTSLQSAFGGTQLPFDDALASRVTAWLTRHR
ncbi:MAG TPA: alpha/beta hydrolase [Steroidobacteraceae bacterium]|jgi:pimeloyl-ACP methyl ester carboxylesterase|nr:alpha/beta hydrolase [Steroidobacteraceae bacterium]